MSKLCLSCSEPIADDGPDRCPNCEPSPPAGQNPGLSLQEAAQLTSLIAGADPERIMAAIAETVRPTGGAVWFDPPPPEHLAELLPQFEIRGLIGKGGMGAVYHAAQPKLEREVAIKLLPPELGADADFVRRFEEEAKILANLQHSGIVSVFDAGQTPENHLFFVMEYVAGPRLHQLIHEARLSVAEALDLATQLCDALEYAHNQGIVHRDIKPSNILVTARKQVKLVDFGLARLTESSAGAATVTLSRFSTAGTPAYMAPEQRKGGGDRRADLYSLGAVFCEMLTRVEPIGAWPNPSEVNSDADARLDAVVNRALQQDPALRFQSAAEFRDALEEIRRKPASARETEERIKPAWRLRLVLWRTLAIVCGFLVVFTIGWLTRREVTIHRNRRKDLAEIDKVMNSMFPELKLPLPPVAGPHGKPAENTTRDPELASRDLPFENTLGMRFVPIRGPNGERLLVSIWETRRGDFAAFREATGRETPKENWKSPNKNLLHYPFTGQHPVVLVNWVAAKQFCEWLTRQDREEGLPAHYAYRLPTSEEWDRAANLSGDAQQDDQIFAWGDSDPLMPGYENFYGQECDFFRLHDTVMLPGFADGFPRTSPAGFYLPNALGLHDMGGNVMEMTLDLEGPPTSPHSTLRGFSWKSGAQAGFRMTLRLPRHITATDYETGFRVVLERRRPPAKTADSGAKSPIAGAYEPIPRGDPFPLPAPRPFAEPCQVIAWRVDGKPLDGEEFAKALGCAPADLGEVLDVNDRSRPTSNLSSARPLFLRTDGTVTTFRPGIRELIPAELEAVRVAGGVGIGMGLRTDGTCQAFPLIFAWAKFDWMRQALADVAQWKDVVAIAAGHAHVVGLHRDGTVSFAGTYGTERPQPYSFPTKFRQNVVKIGAAGHRTWIARIQADGGLEVASNKGDPIEVSRLARVFLDNREWFWSLDESGEWLHTNLPPMFPCHPNYLAPPLPADVTAVEFTNYGGISGTTPIGIAALREGAGGLWRFWGDPGDDLELDAAYCAEMARGCRKLLLFPPYVIGLKPATE